MRNTFKEYLELSNDEKKTLWSRATFVFDTNILLNLYRYTAATRNGLLGALTQLSGRIWLPFNTVEEYYKNRCKVIVETEHKYKDVISKSNVFYNHCKTSFHLNDTDDDLNNLKEFLNHWIESEREKNLEGIALFDDKILKKLLILFENRVGEAFSEVELEQIKEDGKKRYINRIPPGYEDKKKETEMCDNNMYGDLIIWKQIIKYATENCKDIIFVTDDKKNDWWNIIHEETVGPRYELKKEFSDNVGKSFYMYNMNGFLNQYKEIEAGKVINAKMIEEIKQIDYLNNRKINQKNHGRIIYKREYKGDTDYDILIERENQINNLLLLKHKFEMLEMEEEKVLNDGVCDSEHIEEIKREKRSLLRNIYELENYINCDSSILDNQEKMKLNDRLRAEILFEERNKLSHNEGRLDNSRNREW